MSDTPIDADAVRAALSSVDDPEVGMNIVDLGLIYEVQVGPAGIDVRMTMTSPACPMGEMIEDDVDAALTRLAPDLPHRVELVWEPEWSPAMMSEAAKAHFGWSPDDE